MVGEDQATPNFCFEAGKFAWVIPGITVDQLDLFILATVTPDMPFPATACILQEKLGAAKAAAFDLSAACSGFMYGVANASNFIATGTYQYALVIGSDTLSRITDYTDRNTCILFGDGA